MDDTVLKIAMAAFFHDIGKFADPGVLALHKGYQDENAGAFLPVSNGRYSHWHALYTAAFIEQQEASLPVHINTGDWIGADSFIRLAAAHHNPSSPMEHVITVADRLSSGMDREEFDAEDRKSTSFSDYKKTRLMPIFEHLSVSDKKTALVSDNVGFCYPLKSQTAKTIFPEKKEVEKPVNKKQAEEDYKKLFTDFLNELKAIAHKDLDTALWFEHFDSLVQRFTSHIPAARVGKVIPDVSLYDHLRSTAALATAIYSYHQAEGTLNEKSIKDQKEDKILMVSGGFNGIQKFIFAGHGDSRKYRSKLLRGRSFFVSIMSELTGDMICRKLSLPHTSVVFNAGGRFAIMAPNTVSAIESVRQTERKVNEWLIQRTFGEVSISISTTKASSRDFESKRFAGLWERVVRDMDTKKLSKIDLDLYGGAVETYLDQFSNDLSPAICPLCGRRPAVRQIRVGEMHTCGLCRDHVFLGENLVKENYIAVAGVDTAVTEKKLLEPLFDEYQLFFPKGGPNEAKPGDKLIKYWCLGERDQQNTKGYVTSKFINGYVPVYDSEDVSGEEEAGHPKTLNDIASASLEKIGHNKTLGTESLGILKADVDNLGLLMACGLRDNLYTISRMAALSRQMNNFFAMYLPRLLQEDRRFNNVYTVFAGGDDLFLIGPWNRIMELAGFLEGKFDEYVCHNSDIHFSAGITLHKPHTPIDFFARAAERTLEASKHNGKQRITVFDQTVTWEMFHELEKIREEMQHWLDDEWISRVFLYNINFFINMAQTEKALLESFKDGIPIEKMSCTKWRSFLTYTVERNVAMKTDRDKRQERSRYVGSKIAQWLSSFGGALRIPLWIIQYNLR